MKKKKTILTLCSLILGVTISGCSTLDKVKKEKNKTSEENKESALQSYTDYSDARDPYSCDQIYMNKSLEFLSYLENKDKEAIKGMMTKELLNSQNDIDELLDKMFELYQGTPEYNTLGGSPGYDQSGKDISGGGDFFIKTEEETYYCYLGYHYVDPENNDVGLEALVFGTIGYMGRYYQYGVHAPVVCVSDESSDGYVRLGEHVYEENPNGCEISLEEAKLINTRNFQEVVQQFGEPLVNENSEKIYQIAGEENRYLDIFLLKDENGEINYIYDINVVDENRQILETILEKKTLGEN